MLLDLQLDVSDNNLDMRLSLQVEEINSGITNIEQGTSLDFFCTAKNKCGGRCVIPMEPRCLLALRWPCLALFNSLTLKSKIVKARFSSRVTKNPVLLNHFPSVYKKGEKN